MRADDNQQEGMFSYVSPEKRVPADHPLRPIRKMVDEILKEMSPRFAKLYSDVGRPSIALERMLIEQLQYNLLFRWFVGMETLGTEQRTLARCIDLAEGAKMPHEEWNKTFEDGTKV
jgi:transposase